MSVLLRTAYLDEACADDVVLRTEIESLLEHNDITASLLGDDDLRLFTVIGEESIAFALARMDGTVLAPRVTRISRVASSVEAPATKLKGHLKYQSVLTVK